MLGRMRRNEINGETVSSYDFAKLNVPPFRCNEQIAKGCLLGQRHVQPKDDFGKLGWSVLYGSGDLSQNADFVFIFPARAFRA